MDATFQANTADASQINEFLRQKRKPRAHLACYPCRQRKVKCDYGTPCNRCVERDHASLCSYSPQPLRSFEEDARTSQANIDVPGIGGQSQEPMLNQIWIKLSLIESTLQEIKQIAKPPSQTTHKAEQNQVAETDHNSPDVRQPVL